MPDQSLEQQFEVNDRVRYNAKPGDVEWGSNPGTVEEVSGDGWYVVHWDNEPQRADLEASELVAWLGKWVCPNCEEAQNDGCRACSGCEDGEPYGH